MSMDGGRVPDDTALLVEAECELCFAVGVCGCQ